MHINIHLFTINTLRWNSFTQNIYLESCEKLFVLLKNEENIQVRVCVFCMRYSLSISSFSKCVCFIIYVVRAFLIRFQLNWIVWSKWKKKNNKNKNLVLCANGMELYISFANTSVSVTHTYICMNTQTPTAMFYVCFSFHFISFFSSLFFNIQNVLVRLMCRFGIWSFPNSTLRLHFANKSKSISIKEW